MRKENLILGVIILSGLIIIPYFIKSILWVSLQMMYYPLTSTIIVLNLFLWQYLWIRYTEKKTLNK